MIIAVSGRSVIAPTTGVICMLLSGGSPSVHAVGAVLRAALFRVFQKRGNGCLLNYPLSLTRLRYAPHPSALRAATFPPGGRLWVRHLSGERYFLTGRSPRLPGSLAMTGGLRRSLFFDRPRGGHLNCQLSIVNCQLPTSTVVTNTAWGTERVTFGGSRVPVLGSRGQRARVPLYWFAMRRQSPSGVMQKFRGKVPPQS